MNKTILFLNIVLNIVGRLLLPALAIDLLYLYYTKAWYDPIIFIEYSEVVILYIIVILGIIWTIKYCLGNKVYGEY